MIFGFVILNDWSARDIQQWEYVPLGPFQAKAFATSISPWVVTREALEPFRVHGPAQDPAPLPYLKQALANNYDLQLDVGLRTAEMNEAMRICRTNFKYMYWSSVQQLVHHASSGCAMNVGDILGSAAPSAVRTRIRAAACWRSAGTAPSRSNCPAAPSAPSWRTAICWSCAAGARVMATASDSAKSKARFCRRSNFSSLRAKRSNPESRRKSWIASSLRSSRNDSFKCLPRFRRNISDARRMCRTVLMAELEMDALVGWRLRFGADTGPPWLRGPDRPRRKAAAAIRTDVL